MLNLRRFTLTIATFCALSLTYAMRAQVTSGSVTGTVLDSQGAIVPGAKVTLIDEVQATTRITTSSTEGNFVFTPVLPSTYKLVVESTGFKKYEKNGIKVSPGDRIEVADIALNVGAMTETVTVQANAIALKTESAQKDSLILSQQAVDMPIVDRNFMRMLQVVPGFATGDQYSANINGNRNDNISVKLDGISNMDSGVNMCCSTWINMDTIQEMKIVTNSASAAVGHSGGASIQVVTKGGTKDFHGSAYTFLRNESLNARGWNANSTAALAAQRKATYRYNTDGFTLGGPIYIPHKFNSNKDKLFFFAAEEHQNTKSGGGSSNTTVPTAAERAGDFSQTHDQNGNHVVVYDPLTGGLNNGGTPFAGNLIPATRLNSDGQKLLSLLPLPNYTGDNTYNYTYLRQPQHQPELLGTYKFDDNISDRWHAYVRYTRDYYVADNYTGNGSYEFLGTRRTTRKAMGLAFNVTTVISPTFTNEYTMGVSQNLIPNFLIDNQAYTRSALGLQYTSPYPSAIIGDQGPSVSFGVTNGPSLGSGNPSFADNTNFNFIDNLSKVFPSHTLTVGFSVERDRKDQSNNNPVGTINFGTSTTNPFESNFGYANALLGNFNTYSQLDQQRVGKYRFTNVEWYVADTWKATRKLTIDGGIRFYVLQPIYDARGQLGQFLLDRFDPAQAVRLYSHAVNPATGKVQAWDQATNTFANPVLYGTVVPNSGNPLNGFYLAGTNGVPRGIVKSQGVLYGPALGLAYALNSKTVIRTGARIAYDRIQGNPWYTSLSIPPTTRAGTLYYGNLATLNSSTAAFTAPGNNGAGLSPDGHIPTVYSWNFSIQRELPFQTVLEAAYVGNINRHLDQLVDINMPAWGSMWLPQNQDPSFTGVNNLDGTHALPANFYRPLAGLDRMNYPEWGGTSNYNSLQVTANHRLSHNLTFSLAYTFSKVLGTADSIYNASAIPGQVRSSNYGRLAYDRTNSFVISYTYTLPKPIRGNNMALNNFATRLVLNDWQFSGITTFRSGAPYGINYSVSNGSGGTLSLNALITGNPDFGPRPILTGDPNNSNRNLLQYFNLGVVGQAMKGSHGNDSGVNYLTGPGTENTDLTVFKNIPFTRDSRRYVQLRVEAYNVLNHTNWSGVASTVQFASLTSNSIVNLPYYLTTSTTNGGRFGVGAATGPSGGRIVALAVKVYF